MLKGKHVRKNCYSEELVDSYSHVSYVRQFFKNNIEICNQKDNFLAFWSLVLAKLEKTRIIVLKMSYF
jgi:hypothetical protein